MTVTMISRVVAISFVLHLSENVLAPHIAHVGDALHMGSEAEKDLKLGGLLHLTYYASAAIVSVTQSYVFSALRLRASTVLALCTLGVAACCYSMSVLDRYVELVLVRCSLGALLATAQSCMYATVFTSVRPHERSKYGALLSLSIGAGTLIGHVASGSSLHAGMTYRHVCRALSVLYAVVGIACQRCLLRDVKHEYASRAPLSARACLVRAWTFAKNVDYVIASPSNLLLFAQALFGCVPAGVFTAFFPDYLLNDTSMGMQYVNACILLFGIGSAAGMLLGSVCGAWLRKKEMHRELFALAALVSWLSVVPCLALLSRSFVVQVIERSGGVYRIFVLVLCAGALTNFSGSNLRATIMDINPASTQSVSLSVFHACNGIGKAVGPMMIPVATMVFGVQRHHALSASVCAWIISGCLLFRVRHHIIQDITRVNKHERARVF